MNGQSPDSTSLPPNYPGNPEDLSAETLDRCARLLASGEMEWPSGLTEAQQAELLAATREYRRARLVKLIASRIAADIAAETQARAKEARP